jgi:Icc-related predicted phosphoesterase
MKMLIIADIHGDTAALDKILGAAAGEKPDVVICPGDFTDMYNQNTVFSQADIAEMIVQKLLAFNRSLLCVPGNQDPYETLAVFDEYGVNIHGRIRKTHNTVFAGWGGAQTPFNTLLEPTPEETKHVMSVFKDKLSGKEFVLVVHNPPKDTKLDLAGGEKHVGSEEIRKLIDEARPALAISAHIHESGAVDRIGPSTLFYPGPAFEGKYGVATLEKGRCGCRMMSVKL